MSGFRGVFSDCLLIQSSQRATEIRSVGLKMGGSCRDLLIYNAGNSILENNRDRERLSHQGGEVNQRETETLEDVRHRIRF